jgi:hypothetical protein
MSAIANADLIALLVLVTLIAVSPGGIKNHSIKQPVVRFFQPLAIRFSVSFSNSARLVLSLLSFRSWFIMLVTLVESHE